MKVYKTQLQIPIDAVGFPSKMTLIAGTDVLSMRIDTLGLHVNTKNGLYRIIPLPNIKYVEVEQQSGQES